MSLSNTVSPCTANCKLSENRGFCLSCKRTIFEIKNWKEMSMCEKLKVMQSLPTRSLCPTCGVDNKCAITKGKSINTCWCFNISLPASEQVGFGKEGEDCLCRRCLLTKDKNDKS